MTSNVLQYRHFDLRQTINFAGEPINNDDLDGERFRWRGRDDCWHYAAQFHVFLSCGGRASYLQISTRVNKPQNDDPSIVELIALTACVA
jgi:hypothetical protein